MSVDIFKLVPIVWLGKAGRLDAEGVKPLPLL
jgi:hypothetical protein